MALKARQGGAAWDGWPQSLRMRQPEALAAARAELAGEMDFHRFVQYQFEAQWQALKAYANGKGVRIIGDIPIYVAFDSADTWAHPELFQLDGDRRPTGVAGVPPDGFSATGQLWGNPLYDWQAHRAAGYRWWIDRMAASYQRYDVVRIDHFRGFDEYYRVPAGGARRQAAAPGRRARAKSCSTPCRRLWAGGRSSPRTWATSPTASASWWRTAVSPA